mmetsp:Transcript_14320/g.33861  ORF Transcript_14320/g.33861 Transcript_14320/m.33861 type:complete len:169 (+) Transcript_14320:280-786(+)
MDLFGRAGSFQADTAAFAALVSRFLVDQPAEEAAISLSKAETPTRQVAAPAAQGELDAPVVWFRLAYLHGDIEHSQEVQHAEQGGTGKHCCPHTNPIQEYRKDMGAFLRSTWRSLANNVMVLGAGPGSVPYARTYNSKSAGQGGVSAAEWIAEFKSRSPFRKSTGTWP